MVTSPPARRPPSPLLLLVFAALVVVAIFVLKSVGSAPTPNAPVGADGSAAGERAKPDTPTPARRSPAARPAETPEAPEAPEASAPGAPATPSPAAVEAAPKPIPGGGGLPRVSGMDAPEARAANAAAEPAPGAGAAADEDAERLVYAPDREGIRAAIGGEREHLRECYAEWLKADPGLGGRVKVQFVISDPDETDDEALARVSGVKILDTSLTGETAQFIEGCVMNVMSSLRFDPPADGRLVVNYPFAFASEDPAPPNGER